mmetsp:Transcript_144926/g.252762  ORF Transcript_144926/g.252762 Transcript_144926/m.252762 type:complete len:1020 (+) Transcript_144926:106-3165(+)
MSATMDMYLDYIFNSMAPMWMEVAGAIFFAVGFAFMRVECFSGKRKGRAKMVEVSHYDSRKTIEAEVAAGHMIAAVKAWRGAKARTPTRLETLKLVVQAFLEVEPSALVNEITGHIRAYRDELCNSRTAAAVLDVLARNGQVALMEEVRKVLDDDLQIYPTVQIYEALLGGYASAGDEKQVEDVLSKLCTGRMKVSARGYALTIKGFLKNGKVDAAMEQMKAMHRAALTVPSLAVTQLVRASCEAGRGMEIFNIIQGEFSLPPEATTLLLEDCLKRTDLSQARQIEQLACKQAGASALSQGAYDALLKTCVAHGDSYALELFERMQTSKVHISERLCVALLSRCAETKFLRFAEEIVKFIRGRNEMTMAAYSALMKVYAYAGLYGKACDLYDQIIAQGLEPDSMMYGCLMKFAVECGRTDLSRELFSKAPSLDIQNYMSLIRAAGRDKDIERAFQVLQKLKESGVVPDIAAYNCVLDVCVSAGDLSRARDLMGEMHQNSKLDIITYNTLLKGHCSLGDIRGAKELISEMESIGLAPNDVSYNCMINAAVSKGMWQEAWNTVDMMEGAGVKADHYTVSIMMKALKRTRDSRQVGRALALLDRSGLDACSDEVLLNTLLETCIRHHEHHRLEMVVDGFITSGLLPSVHTYGSLIKACSSLKRVEKCWEFWQIMVEHRAFEPNDIVLGCMLDALVCNESVEEAVTLFKKWQSKVPANTIMYSTLIKGFANSRQPSRAMDMWREMQQLKLPMNTVVYNALIDAQARVGLMDEVGFLMQSMESHGCVPDSITYSTIVKGYCFKGDLDKAFEVFRSMRQNQMANDSVIYNTLLDGCVRHNRMDLAETLLEDMNRFSISPSNFTLGILVKMYGRRRQLDKAFKTVEEIPKKYGFKANGQVKTCLINACLNNNDVDLAMKVFDELRCSEQGADRKNYTSMISSLLRHGRLEQAVKLVEDAYGLDAGARVRALPPGQRLEADSLEQLLRALTQRGQMERLGVPLMNRLRAARIPLSGKLLSMFTQSMN